MKKCSFCAEEIKDAATKCKHCKSDLSINAKSDTASIEKCPFCKEQIQLNSLKCKHCGGNIAKIKKQALVAPVAFGCLLVIILFFLIILFSSDSNNNDSLEEFRKARDEAQKNEANAQHLKDLMDTTKQLQDQGYEIKVK